MAGAGCGEVRQRLPFSITSTNVCLCGSFIPQRVNFAPGREEDKGKLDDPTQQVWFDRPAYVVAPTGTQGTAGRNTVRGPGYQRVDFSLSKRFPIGMTRLEFRAEVFNLLNHTNFGTPDNNISNPTTGVITTADDARSMQFGFRLMWVIACRSGPCGTVCPRSKTVGSVLAWLVGRRRMLRCVDQVGFAEGHTVPQAFTNIDCRGTQRRGRSTTPRGT
jgi:hypothetical protein